MIIYRYLSGQLLISTASVGFILSIILISGRLLNYMAEAANGEIEGWAVFAVLFYRFPEFLRLILPLSLFLGVLLAYGRMYVDYEMTVLRASGVGDGKVLLFTMIPAICMSAVVAFFSLQLTPAGIQKSSELLVKQYTRSPLELLTSGRFVKLKRGDVVYAEKISLDKTTLEGVFTSTKNDKMFVTIVADSGKRVLDEATGAQYMELKNGFRYESTPGEKEFSRIEFESYTFKLKEPNKHKKVKALQSKSTGKLIGSTNKEELAELHWRLSLPVLAFVIVLLAVPLSKVNPRQGRFLKLIPAMLLYLSYVAMLVMVQKAIGKGSIGVYPGFWGVHALFLVVALILFEWENMRDFLLRR